METRLASNLLYSQELEPLISLPLPPEFGITSLHYQPKFYIVLELNPGPPSYWSDTPSTKLYLKFKRPQMLSQVGWL